MKCLSCENKDFIDILDLGNQPWCGNFLNKEDVGKELFYPLKLIYCNNCQLLQLSHRVPKETMFGNHQYLSGTTKTLTEHFYNIAKENIAQFHLKTSDCILDIGGNDGTQLLQYKKLGIKCLINIESAKNIASISSESEIMTFNNFFNLNFCKEYIRPNSIKLINASGVFFHLEELRDVINAIEYILEDGGVFVVQFMYAGDMLDNLTFDMIYHEHLCYYTINSFLNLFTNTSLSLCDLYHSKIHSGTIIAKLIKNTTPTINKKVKYLIEVDKKKYTLNYIKKFAAKIKSEKYNFKKYLIELKKQGKRVYAYGAPAKGCTLLNYFEIDNSLIIKAVEVNELKVGRYLPKSHIPIEKESEIDIPDYYLLLSYNFKDEIIEKNYKKIKNGLKFIVPFPTIKIIDKSVL